MADPPKKTRPSPKGRSPLDDLLGGMPLGGQYGDIFGNVIEPLRQHDDLIKTAIEPLRQYNDLLKTAIEPLGQYKDLWKTEGSASIALRALDLNLSTWDLNSHANIASALLSPLETQRLRARARPIVKERR